MFKTNSPSEVKDVHVGVGTKFEGHLGIVPLDQPAQSIIIRHIDGNIWKSGRIPVVIVYDEVRKNA
jgi:hypothetical protein